MRAQLQSMGLSIDWSREIATCDPSYYKHQQKMFLDMLGKGLVYRKNAKVNWDPVDHTVLANEQVIDGRGWRSNALVEQRELTQWFFKITEYSQDLLTIAGTLDRWPEKVRLMQKNWIGRSDGASVRFALKQPAQAFLKSRSTPRGLIRFSVLNSWLFHPITRSPRRWRGKRRKITSRSSRNAIGSAPPSQPSKPPRKKALTPDYRSSIRSTRNWLLPVYVANFVLMDYGTGAIFGCPAHDQRDFEFSQAYGLGYTIVVCPENADPAQFDLDGTAYDGDGHLINSRFLDGMNPQDAREEVDPSYLRAK